MFISTFYIIGRSWLEWLTLMYLNFSKEKPVWMSAQPTVKYLIIMVCVAPTFVVSLVTRNLMGEHWQLMVAMSTISKQSQVKLRFRQIFDIEAKWTLLIPEFKRLKGSELFLFKNLKRSKRSDLCFSRNKKDRIEANPAYSRTLKKLKSSKPDLFQKKERLKRSKLCLFYYRKTRTFIGNWMHKLDSI